MPADKKGCKWKRSKFYTSAAVAKEFKPRERSFIILGKTFCQNKQSNNMMHSRLFWLLSTEALSDKQKPRQALLKNVALIFIFLNGNGLFLFSFFFSRSY